MNNLRCQIDDALPSVATVICAIIYQYAYPEIYEWSVDSPTIGKPPTILNRTPTCVEIVHNDPGIRQPWYSYVAHTDFRRGPRNWLVGIDFEVGRGIGWLGIGITKATSNYCNVKYSLAGFASNGTWLISINSEDIFYDDGRTSVDAERYSGPILQTSRLRWPPALANLASVEFEADPSSLQIVGRLSPSGARFVLATACNNDELSSLRPSITVSGCIAAVILVGLPA